MLVNSYMLTSSIVYVENTQFSFSVCGSMIFQMVGQFLYSNVEIAHMNCMINHIEDPANY